MCFRRLILSTVFVLLFAQCKQEYNALHGQPFDDLLVVDGFINAGNAPTRFILSRTLHLKDTVTKRPEAGALLTIEGENGFIALLQEDEPGDYTGGPYSFSEGSRYKLHIKTGNGKEYYSDYATVYLAPAIDSVGWDRSADGVSIYLNTHDQNAKARYYRWSYEQTWEFHSAYQSSLKYENGYIVPRLNYDSIYTCWHSEPSTDLLLGSSEALSENVIYQQPINFIPQSSWQLSVLYSILVRQEVFDAGTFRYMQTLKKITEQSGSFFDPQPVSVQGNIYNIANRKETVLGYLYASSVTEKRIFIRNTDVPGWRYESGCYSFLAGYGSYASIANGSLIPLDDGPKGLRVTTDFCGNCTLRGEHHKPDFWP